MALPALRERARSLRIRGYGIGEISEQLHASKSTVSHWCRDITLSKEQQGALSEKVAQAGMRGRLRAAELKRDARIQQTYAESEKGRCDIGTITKRDLYMMGIALYWGEGYKSGNEECGLTNSDPAIIRVFIKWLREIFDVPARDLILRVSINETHANRVQTVERYWSDTVRIPLSQFTSTSLIKARSKKTYSNAGAHFGTLRVKVRRGTALRRRIMGSLAELQKQAMR